MRLWNKALPISQTQPVFLVFCGSSQTSFFFFWEISLGNSFPKDFQLEKLPAIVSNINKNYACLHLLLDIFKFKKTEGGKIKHNLIIFITEVDKVLSTPCAFWPLCLCSKQFPVWNPLSYSSYVQILPIRQT